MPGLAILPPREAGGEITRVIVVGGEVGFRAELEGDTKSSMTIEQSSSPGTSTSSRRY